MDCHKTRVARAGRPSTYVSAISDLNNAETQKHFMLSAAAASRRTWGLVTAQYLMAIPPAQRLDSESASAIQKGGVKVNSRTYRPLQSPPSLRCGSYMTTRVKPNLGAVVQK